MPFTSRVSQMGVCISFGLFQKPPEKRVSGNGSHRFGAGLCVRSHPVGIATAEKKTGGQQPCERDRPCRRISTLS